MELPQTTYLHDRFLCKWWSNQKKKDLLIMERYVIHGPSWLNSHMRGRLLVKQYPKHYLRIKKEVRRNEKVTGNNT